MNHGLAPTLLERRWLGRFDLGDVEEPAKDSVHGQERCRHPPTRAQEVPAAQSEPRPQAPRCRENALFDLTLRGRLGQRGEFLVGDQPGGERHLGAQPLTHAWTETEGVVILHRHN